MYVCMYVCMYVHMYEFLDVCMYVCMDGWMDYVCMQTNTSICPMYHAPLLPPHYSH